MRDRNRLLYKNYLDYTPKPSESYSYVSDEQGAVTILKENKGLYHWLAQKILRKPRVTQIHLDEFGNFIWPLMDGKRTIQDIALLVKEEFGDKAEPLYKRLVQFFRNLECCGFVKVRVKNGE